jgi:hypothetical protein
LFSFLHAPIAATLKSQRNGSSPRSALVPNIVSAFAKNNSVSTKYKSNPQNTSKPATRSNNRVIHLPPLPDPNETCALLSAREALPLDFAPGSIKPTFSLDSKTLRRYIVEDYLFAATGERVLLLVATSHPSFNSHWFRIYEQQEKRRKPLIFGDILFFQIKAVVLKNAYRANFISGHYTQKKIGNLFSSRGGAALGLTFPGCPRSFEFELKSADVFFLCATLQVWGTTKTVRSFRKQLSKLKNEASCESYFTRYLAELHGDESQTLLLCNAYS